MTSNKQGAGCLKPFGVFALFVLAAIGLLVVLDQLSTPESPKLQAPSSEAADEQAGLGAFSQAQICKATIAALMGRDPEIISVEPRSGFYVVSYLRPSDGTRWNSKCRILGNQVLWGNLDGRWRNDPADSRLSFRTEGETLTITERHSDGSAVQETFSHSKLE